MGNRGIWKELPMSPRRGEKIDLIPAAFCNLLICGMGSQLLGATVAPGHLTWDESCPQLDSRKGMQQWGSGNSKVPFVDLLLEMAISKLHFQKKQKGNASLVFLKYLLHFSIKDMKESWDWLFAFKKQSFGNIHFNFQFSNKDVATGRSCQAQRQWV